LLADAGDKAIVGCDGWLFYRPGFQYLTERPAASLPAHEPSDPAPAIVQFRDQLAARGIRLVVLVAPSKESIYPEMLARRTEGAGVVVARQTRELLDTLRAAGVDVVDLFDEYRRAKQERQAAERPRLYLAQDSHWSPEGVRIAAAAVAGQVRERGWLDCGAVSYSERSVAVRRFGDVLQMLQVPELERLIGPDAILCSQVLEPGTGAPFRPLAGARILVLGDSFLRIYERDEPQAAGFVAHLARELKQPIAAIISDGGASTLVRQELHRRAGLLAGKKLVVWEFVERDIRYGAEGWQVIPLPPKTVKE